ncbi:pentapeptide repeat-containing protein [Shimia sp.]|uniref:pentapeptide repeat-containing protein n=1 Tax=Shimia sp. TaxID=1954381 RepID=UPI003B8CCF10
MHTTLPIEPQVFWLCVTLAGIVVLSGLIYAVLPTSREDADAKKVNVQKALGAQDMPEALFFLLVLFWLVLALCLFTGVIVSVGMIAQQLFEGTDDETARLPLIQLAALTATLGATVALPFTVIRLKLTQEQTRTANASLFNQKITEAAADLHAQRQVTKEFDGKRETVWEDDIVRRNAAIDRLEGLVREEPQEAARVSRLLSVYVRELSDEIPAQPTPDTEDVKALRDWANKLTIPRSDMQNAVQVLGRLATITDVDTSTLSIDLRKANLQAMDLFGLSFDRAQLSNARLQGVYLRYAELQGADLRNADLQGADLWDAELQGANLSGAKLQGASLNSAELQGADLWRAELDVSTNLTAALFAGASVRFVDFLDVPQIDDHIDAVFGDGTTKLPEDVKRPATWPNEKLNEIDYNAQWRAFAARKGVEILK